MPPSLDNLFHKRGSIREEALTALIKYLKNDIRLGFLQNNYITILSRCEISFKKGSAAEIKLAAQAIGLLALTVGPGDCANEIYNESLRLLPLALKSKSQPIAILECLSIVTFVRDNDFDETERSMQIIWEYINKKCIEKDAATVVASAISAWSLLLAKIDHCRLDNNFWKVVIPFFLELLKSKYEVSAEHAIYHPVVVEALALVSEKGSQHKFCSEADDNSYTGVLGVADMQHDESAVDEKWNVSELLKEYNCKQTSLKVGRYIFKLTTSSEQKKMSYLKHFLGDGFNKHIVDNNFLHNVFNGKREEYRGPTLYVPEEKEVTAEIYIPGDRDIRNRERLINNSRNSIMSKGKTQLRNKLRTIAQEKKTCQGFLHDEMTDG
ncbi:IFRD domain-containing protein [Heracleum sosnowskyi]|uniref:IFRD domain-containing protein n=1 Tax=Heracleum sosnowskyi TaxID=360622 RepID=A0AAD8J5Y0_9APIA|nr:IFRD domain-containing protein [Heracleum sosnowskyi]